MRFFIVCGGDGGGGDLLCSPFTVHFNDFYFDFDFDSKSSFFWPPVLSSSSSSHYYFHIFRVRGYIFIDSFLYLFRASRRVHDDVARAQYTQMRDGAATQRFDFGVLSICE